MAREQPEIRVERNADGHEPTPPAGTEPSIGELFKRVTADTTELVRQEVALAKVEMRQALSTLEDDVARVGTGVGLALVGVLALTAFLIAGLGQLLDDRYWLSALIVGLVFLGIGTVLARNTLAEIKRRGIVPDQTVGSLRDDAAWAKQEAGEVKRELTS
ncbi:MAG TPA: phage holin family protein [Gemmatimonadaceae bacterium]|jgi:Protein of unknown function (DUF1469).